MRLFERLKKHLEEHQRRHDLAKDARGRAADIELQAATAVLLLEAAYGDEEYLWCEHRAVVGALKRGFGIGSKEAARLTERADEIRPPAVKLADVSQVLAERLDKKQREEALTLLWEVIHADDIEQSWEVSFAEHVARAIGLTPAEAHRIRESVVSR
jgi:uncharacterized tellurite resistance protein B-like protein